MILIIVTMSDVDLLPHLFLQTIYAIITSEKTWGIHSCL